jgi:multiple sugar transport system permease protein
MTVTPAPAVPSGPSNVRSDSRAGRTRRTREQAPAGVSRTAGYWFVALYVGLLLLLGIAPAAYAIYLALAANTGGGFASAFHTAFTDYRFWPSFGHILVFMAEWLVAQTLLVVGLVLMMHNMAQRLGAVFRFLFYIPGALAGAATVNVLLFMHDPTASPFAFALHWLGYAVFDDTIQPNNLPAIFAVMAFWTGAGGWIVVMYGALNNIPHELIEAAQIDGSNAFQTALRIKLPLIRKWVVYMLLLSFAGGTQLFVEPTVLGGASLGIGITKYWSPNQLGWFVASQYNQYNEAAAISVMLLILGLVVAGLLVWRGRLFEVD